jgi:hypothetical protein
MSSERYFSTKKERKRQFKKRNSKNNFRNNEDRDSYRSKVLHKIKIEKLRIEQTEEFEE